MALYLNYHLSTKAHTQSCTEAYAFGIYSGVLMTPLPFATVATNLWHTANDL